MSSDDDRPQGELDKVSREAMIEELGRRIVADLEAIERRERMWDRVMLYASAVVLYASAVAVFCMVYIAFRPR